jgi:hypothetical protein
MLPDTAQPLLCHSHSPQWFWLYLTLLYVQSPWACPGNISDMKKIYFNLGYNPK